LSELARCSALTKTYVTTGGQVEALQDVDASFARDRVTAVVGPSGSGKSTLLRLLAGLERPTHGSVAVDGEALETLSAGALRSVRRERVAFVAQRPAENFLAHLTIAEHVSLPGGGAGGQERAEALFAQLGLASRIHERPAALSGGEQARAALALALLRRTPLILLDEPTAELDASSALALLEAVREHADEGSGFLVATHDPDVIAAADAALHLRSGRVVEGPPPARGPGRAARAADADAPLAVEARAVSKRYRRGSEIVHAVEEADLLLRRSELGVLVGRSGSGKSTLLGMLAGWMRPDEGEVRYAGGADPQTLPWHELAIVPQKFGLLMDVSVRENVELPLRLAGRPGDGVMPLLEELGLDALAARLPTEISIGQQQRVAVARALVVEPAVLLADEPASHQDGGFRETVWRAIAAAAERGSAVLAVTHEPDVAAYATTVWEMHDGRISATG
jgi:putative ABC transport system ATP-binding protein